MKNYLVHILFCALTVFTFLPNYAQSPINNDWAQFSRYSELNQTADPEIVFIGNSLTDGWGALHPEFFTMHNFACRGISGQVTAQMLVRFRSDVVDLHPKKVVILAGTNDIAQNPYHVAFSHIISNIHSMCDIARQNGIEPVLCTVLPCASFYWNQSFDPREQIRTLNEQISALASEQGIILVDYYSTMKNEYDGLRSEFTEDGVHPNSDGYDVMENILLTTLGN